MNGLSEFILNGDLLQRCIILSLPSIQSGQRLLENKLITDFNDAHPGILGALLDMVVCALNGVDEVDNTLLPRLADFAIFAEAGVQSLQYEKGQFLKAFNANQSESEKIQLESSLLAVVLNDMLCSDGGLSTDKSHHMLQGTATELWEKTNKYATKQFTRIGKLPLTPSAFSGELNQITNLLENNGFRIMRSRGKNGDKIIKITRTVNKDYEPNE